MHLRVFAVAFLMLVDSPFGLAAEEVTSENNAKQEIGFRGQRYTPAPGVTQTTEIYKATAEKNLDITLHFPQGWKAEDKRPVIVFFFGGGWKKGTTKQFLIQADYFASRGIVTARPNYRLGRDLVTPAKCVEDARSSVRWLRANAARLGIDPKKVISAGGSAGGHLAYCTSIKQGADDPNDDTTISCIPQAMVLYNPGLFKSDSEMVRASVAGGKMSAERLELISPLDHVDKDTPPALILFGTKDKLKKGADEYLRLAKEVGIRAEMFTAEGENHGFFNTEPWLSKTTAEVDKYLVSLGYLDEMK
jgi:acetyl esterase/lipase